MTEKKQKRKVERRPVAKVINVQPPRPADDLFNPFAEAKAAEDAKAAGSTKESISSPQVTSPQVTPPQLQLKLRRLKILTGVPIV